MNTEDSLKDAKSVSQTKYSSVEELHAALSKKWTIWDHMESCWYRFFWNWFSAIPSEIKYFFQRGTRGYSDRDSWNIDQYLIDILLCNLVELKANGHCIPSTHAPDGSWGYDETRWKAILDAMIQGFALVKKCIIGDEIIYLMGITEEDKIRYNKSSFTHLTPQPRCTTLEEETEMNTAFDLFKKYFWCLND